MGLSQYHEVAEQGLARHFRWQSLDCPPVCRFLLNLLLRALIYLVALGFVEALTCMRSVNWIISLLEVRTYRPTAIPRARANSAFHYFPRSLFQRRCSHI